MQRTFRRLALMSCCGLGFLAAFAPASAAAFSVTTLSANFVTTSSATLHGVIDTGGQATSWEFQYGTSSAYAAATPFQTIPPGPSAMNYEAATLDGLRPNTTYHFRLLAYFGIATPYQEADPGNDVTFTTKPTGRLQLLSSRLQASGGFVHVPLKCGSKLPCQGAFTIVALAPAAKAGTACATKSFAIRPGKQHAFAPRISPACRSILRKQPGHVLRARFVSSPTTGQLGVNKKIKLIG